MSIPVLSVQITDAFTIDLHEPKTQTSKFFFMCFVVLANASVTARGIPLGIVITTRVTETMRICTNVRPFSLEEAGSSPRLRRTRKRIMSMMKRTRPATLPVFAIS